MDLSIVVNTYFSEKKELRNQNIEYSSTQYAVLRTPYGELSTIDPSTSLGTTVRAGPNGADRVLVDKERRLKEIFSAFTVR